MPRKWLEPWRRRAIKSMSGPAGGHRTNWPIPNSAYTDALTGLVGYRFGEQDANSIDITLRGYCLCSGCRTGIAGSV